MKPKYVAHHDDPPCRKRLKKDGSCKKCKCVPDTQSKVLIPYCPDCKVQLKKMQCPKCNQNFVIAD